MKKEFEPLYGQLIEEIESCARASPDEKEMATACFWLAGLFWQKVKERIKERGFKSDTEEIEFFKEVKPRFTGHIEYFVILSSALTFVPEKREAAIEYWLEEEKRLERFRIKNGNFVGYFELGSKQMDAVYFKKVNKDLKPFLKLVSYDDDPEFCSSHDYLVRILIGQKMYHDYVMKRLKELQVKSE